MVNEQPEALRLADIFDDEIKWQTTPILQTEVAAELRRQYEVNQELLAALIVLLADAENCGGYSLVIHNIARAAITKAERTTT